MLRPAKHKHYAIVGLMKRPKDQSGFTVVEIIIVLALIVILTVTSILIIHRRQSNSQVLPTSSTQVSPKHYPSTTTPQSCGCREFGNCADISACQGQSSTSKS